MKLFHIEKTKYIHKGNNQKSKSRINSDFLSFKMENLYK